MESIVKYVSANLVYLLLIYSYCVSYMLYDFMQDGMIFSFYGRWLRKEENRNLEIESHNNRLSEDLEKGIIELSELKLIDKVIVPIWKKPLGLCLKCFHIWIYIILYIIILIFLNQSINVAFFIISISISYHNLVKNYYS